MSLRCTGDCYLVELDPIEKSYKGMLHLPEQTRQHEEWRNGTIVAVGERCKEGLKVGDKFRAIKWHGNKFTYEGKEYCSLRENEIPLLWIENGS